MQHVLFVSKSNDPFGFRLDSRIASCQRYLLEQYLHFQQYFWCIVQNTCSKHIDVEINWKWFPTTLTLIEQWFHQIFVKFPPLFGTFAVLSSLGHHCSTGLAPQQKFSLKFVQDKAVLHMTCSKFKSPNTILTISIGTHYTYYLTGGWVGKGGGGVGR